MADNPKSGNKDDLIQINELWNKAAQALATGDWEAYSEVWAHKENIQIIHPHMNEWLKGWDIIKGKYKSEIRSGGNFEISSDKPDIHISPSGDMAWATVKVYVDVENNKKMVLWETLVFEKIKNEWKMVHGHVSLPADPK